jgi:DNA-binding NtrC family response regulator
VNTRVIAATHRDLPADVASGRFREDLFHRLAGGILRLPPIRERGEDVALLIDAFLKRINQDAQGRPEAQEKTISPQARTLLLSHTWPGNVRELYHTLVRASIWSTTQQIQASDVSSAVLQPFRRDMTLLDQPLVPGFNLQNVLDEVTRTYLARALKQAGGRKSVAASLLGFANYQTLDNRMRKVHLTSDSQATDVKNIKK